MYKDKKVVAIVLCAGRGSRMGFDKMLFELEGQTVAYRAINAFQLNGYVDEILVTAGENFGEIQGIAGNFTKVKQVVKGGETRGISVANAMKKVAENSLVAIHDGARPFVKQEVINEAIEGGFTYTAAVPCVPVKDTIKEAQGGFVKSTPQRSGLYITQTPQVFWADLYKELSEKYFDEELTDDAQLFEKAGVKVKITRGDYGNYKITTPDDVGGIKKETEMRIGHGYDVHKLTEGRKLIMGGVTIPFEKGLMGHSDGDVVLHAVMDSLLGAMALGDIGKHFPDTQEQYRGIDSMVLFQKISDLIFDKGADIENLDVTILCQRPKLAPYILSMRENIARVLCCTVDKVSVKATTEEGLGFTGEGLGIACHAVCLLNEHTLL
ncbi:MAG: 2-C-methyl-D-erythritol 2,4-cyclodiphosphate synthase [Oscillospiraceae bacterium]